MKNKFLISCLIAAFSFIKEIVAQVPFLPLEIVQDFYPPPYPVIDNYGVIYAPSMYSGTGFDTKINSLDDANYMSGTEIVLKENFYAANLTGEGHFHGFIEKPDINAIILAPDATFDKYEKVEIGIQLDQSITNSINNFLAGGSGINPYDPDQIKIECIFKEGAYNNYKRYAFFYKDFYEQNNSWVETPTSYNFRVRFAPPLVGQFRCYMNLYINGVLTSTLSAGRFNVSNSGNLGHLKMGNGNLLKLQYETGPMFFGVGQNIAYAVPSIQNNCSAYDCVSPFSFQKQRNYISDLASNGGNLVRVRMDAINMLCEWPYKKMLTSDPNPDPNRTLGSYLTNYNDNQRYLWEFDKTVGVMESTDIRAILCLLPDQSFSVDGAYDPNHVYTWDKNPYSSITGNSIAGCKAFFSNTQSMATYRKWLYYVMARYGYSTSIGIWEMINETVNVANSSSNPHLIDSDLAFNTDVQNWVCDMKYYLETLGNSTNAYPLHPVTTGFVSSNNAKNIAYSCLNVWSSNSYVTNIDSASGKYTDQDYDNRTKALIGANNAQVAPYFSNGKPFFWGELGLADGVNFIDEYSDRPFHNAIWASSMSGCISNGMYWNDWEQKKGTNHRQNFQALRAFTNMIDFTQRLAPDESKDNGAGGLNTREIHTWWMRNSAKNYIVGWTKNNSANWTQDFQNLPTNFVDAQGTVFNFQDTALTKTYYNNSLIDYTCFSTNQNPETKISGLLISTNYKIKIYDTYNGANELEVKTVLSSANGTLSFRRSMYSYQNSPFNPDYAFIIKPNSVWRIANNGMITINDTIYATTLDTVNLYSSYIKNNSEYEFNWNSTNNKSIHDSIISVNYPIEGYYSLSLEAKNLNNDSVINHNFTIIISDKIIDKTMNSISVFPIPANNHIFIQYDNEIITNPTISCVDVLGKEYELRPMDLFKFNTSNLSNGIYFIKFKYSNYEKVFKINISH